MVYNSPSGIMVLDLATMTSKLLVPNLAQPAAATTDAAAPVRERGFGGRANAIVVGHKTNSIFFTRTDPETHANAVYKADTNTGVVRKLIDLPPRVSISSVNADETLGAGRITRWMRRAAIRMRRMRSCRRWVWRAGWCSGCACGGECRSDAADQRGAGRANVQSDDKGAMMERRLAARIPVVLFTIRLEPGPNGEKAGTIKMLLHSTDWVNHLLFSRPTRNC